MNGSLESAFLCECQLSEVFKPERDWGGIFIWPRCQLNMTTVELHLTHAHKERDKRKQLLRLFIEHSNGMQVKLINAQFLLNLAAIFNSATNI